MVAFDKMFNMSNVAITSLHDFIKNFSKDGISKVPNENISSLNQQMNSVCECLAESNSLSLETPVHFLTVLNLCSVQEFFCSFELILNNERVRQMESDGAKVNDKRTPDRVKNITRKAKKYFRSL